MASLTVKIILMKKNVKQKLQPVERASFSVTMASVSEMIFSVIQRMTVVTGQTSHFVVSLFIKIISFEKGCICMNFNVVTIRVT